MVSRLEHVISFQTTTIHTMMTAMPMSPISPENIRSNSTRKTEKIIYRTFGRSFNELVFFPFFPPPPFFVVVVVVVFGISFHFAPDRKLRPEKYPEVVHAHRGRFADYHIKIRLLRYTGEQVMQARISRRLSPRSRSALFGRRTKSK